MDGKGKREGVTHCNSPLPNRVPKSTRAPPHAPGASYTTIKRATLVHAPHGVICAGAKDGLGSTRTLGKVLRPTVSRFKDAETTRRGDMLDFMS